MEVRDAERLTEEDDDDEMEQVKTKELFAGVRRSLDNIGKELVVLIPSLERLRMSVRGKDGFDTTYVSCGKLLNDARLLSDGLAKNTIEETKKSEEPMATRWSVDSGKETRRSGIVKFEIGGDKAKKRVVRPPTWRIGHGEA